ncbi:MULTISPECIES: epoxyqueuosine reductase QueH [Calditerrivibrio]|jgi:predicted adenine nucleotide alpha hydrolase (AANH) superfamily ATPase|uniref:Epoxyqueuosine reductase QueH n=1 Tax=Calditerrivibrio nitroreducens TaxID=477976 RepID=A0A2J6WLL3_9BACT|nr:MAG: hypothetical protein C0187_04315 [Calditerrivibrio nitroreducens]
MEKILLHQCCGPCSIYPITILEDKFEITGYFYNPNIHPVLELYTRLENVIKVNNFYNVKSIYNDEYGLRDFFKFKDVEKEKRCSYCYAIRLKNTAKFASENGFRYYTSSLLYSKYQNHAQIRDLGENFGKEFNVEFYYYDFREGWKDGIRISKEMNIYRQQYCGCIFSEEERYMTQLSRKIRTTYNSL